MYRAANTPQEYDYLWLQEEFARIEISLRLAAVRLINGTFGGRTTNGPCELFVNFNVATVNRTGVGVYEMTEAGALSGLTVLQPDLQIMHGQRIAPSVDSDQFVIATNPVGIDPLVIDIRCYELYTLPNGNIARRPYDILATDRIGVLIFGEYER